MHDEYRVVFLLLAVILTSVTTVNSQDNMGYFWHVTDMHVDPTYNTESPGGSCGDAPEGQESWGEFGDYLCDSPWNLIISSVNAMHEIKSDVDFLIWTGDDTPHIYNDTLLDKEAVYTIISNLTDVLQEVFPDYMIYPALGNHDWSPKSALPGEPDPLYARIAARWSHWLNEEASQTFSQGGYYTLPIADTEIDAIVLNTNLYYTSNTVENGTGDPAEQLEWLDGLLTNMNETGRKAMIITHIPPGMFEKHRSKYWFYPEKNNQFHDLLLKHAGVIGSFHAGHHHTDSFKVVYDANDEAVSSILIAPAVTPWETTLPDVIGGAANNPAIRLVKYDRKTGVTLNIEQYYLNLTETNLNGDPQWISEYNATVYYGQPDMNTASLDNIAKNLLTDDELFQKYYAANGVNYAPNEVCTGECRFVHYCAITEINYDAYENCVASPTSAGSPKHIRDISFVILCAIIGFFYQFL